MGAMKNLYTRRSLSKNGKDQSSAGIIARMPNGYWRQPVKKAAEKPLEKLPQIPF